MKSISQLSYNEFMNIITKSYEFRCSNYAVAYNFIQYLDRLRYCDYSGIIDDFISPPASEWIIFFTCLPKDAERLRKVANYIPSSIPANIRIIDENEEEI